MKMLDFGSWKSAFVNKDSAKLDGAAIAMPPTSLAPSVVEIGAKRSGVDAVVKMLRDLGMTKRDAEKALDGVEAGDIVATYTMSTGVIDRPGDKIEQAGWDLTEYRSNPVMLFGHDANSPPIGKALGAAVVNGSLRGTFKFAPASVYEFGATIGRLVKGGFMPAGSVGFAPIDVRVAEDRMNPDDAWQRIQPPLDFIKSKLLEFSAVPIPANPEALVDARSIASEDVRVLRQWAERILSTDGDKVVILPRPVVERMAKIGQTSSLVFNVSESEVKLADVPPIEISVEVSVGEQEMEEPSAEGEPVEPTEEPSAEGELVMSFDSQTTKPIHTCPSCGYSGEPSEFAEVEGGKLACPNCGHVDVPSAFLGATEASFKQYESIDFSPPEGVKEECALGVKWYEEGKGGDGLVDATVSWARRLASGEKITPDKARKMRAWLARHEVDLQAEGAKPGDDGYPSPGRVAWALWGGTPAVAWSEKIVSAMDKEDEAAMAETAAALPNPLKGWHSDFDSPQALRAFVDEVTKVAVEKAIMATTGRLPD